MARTGQLSRWSDTYASVSLKPLTEAKLAYVAGIIDGEGSFTVTVRSNTFGITVGVTDRCLVEWLRDEIGGNAYFDLEQTKGGRLVSRWNISRNADLHHLLPLLAPYLVIKRAQAQAMFALVEHQRSYPEYEVPTSRSVRAERDRRRDVAAAWKARGQELRLAVRSARYSDIHLAR